MLLNSLHFACLKDSCSSSLGTKDFTYFVAPIFLNTFFIFNVGSFSLVKLYPELVSIYLLFSGLFSSKLSDFDFSSEKFLLCFKEGICRLFLWCILIRLIVNKFSWEEIEFKPHISLHINISSDWNLSWDIRLLSCEDRNEAAMEFRLHLMKSSASFPESMLSPSELLSKFRWACQDIGRKFHWETEHRAFWTGNQYNWISKPTLYISAGLDTTLQDRPFDSKHHSTLLKRPQSSDKEFSNSHRTPHIFSSYLPLLFSSLPAYRSQTAQPSRTGALWKFPEYPYHAHPLTYDSSSKTQPFWSAFFDDQALLPDNRKREVVRWWLTDRSFHLIFCTYPAQCWIVGSNSQADLSLSM